jgi:hypothetical protein
MQVNMEVMDLEICDFCQYDVKTRQLYIIEVKRNREWFAQWALLVRPYWDEIVLARKTGVVPDHVLVATSRKRALSESAAGETVLSFNE